MDRGNEDIVVGFSLHTNLAGKKKSFQEVTRRFARGLGGKTKHTQKQSELFQTKRMHHTRVMGGEGYLSFYRTRVVQKICLCPAPTGFPFDTWNIPPGFKFLSVLCQKATPPCNKESLQTPNTGSLQWGRGILLFFYTAPPLAPNPRISLGSDHFWFIPTSLPFSDVRYEMCFVFSKRNGPLTLLVQPAHQNELFGPQVLVGVPPPSLPPRQRKKRQILERAPRGGGHSTGGGNLYCKQD